ncbi:ArsR family transcriptional regulator [Alicyclobacillus sacchari]
MIALLNVRERCVCELVPLFGISQPAISKHLSG